MSRVKMTRRIFIFVLLGLFCHGNVLADCVYGAKSKTQYVVLDSHTILLKGGIGSDILIKSLSFFSKNSELTILKDSFCSYDTAVLYVNGEVVDVSVVKKL